MFRNLVRYGVYKPYVLTVSVIVFIIMMIIHSWIALIVGLAALVILVMTIIRNIYRYHLITELIKDQDMHDKIHALDLATKKGYSLIELTNQATSAFVDGLEEDTDDYTEEALKNAQRDSDTSRIKLNHGDVRYLPYASDHFNVITIMPSASSRFVGHHEIDYEDAFQEAIRVLAPGGSALIVMPKRSALRVARFLYSQDKTIDVFLAKPDHQLLFGYQPIVIKKKVPTEQK